MLSSMSESSPKQAPHERTVAVVWPSIAAGAWGRWLGQLYSNRVGVRIGGVPLTLGWLAVILSAPLAALLYLGRKAPRKPFVLFGPINRDGVRYRLTTERVLIERPFEKDVPPVSELALNAFDSVDLEGHPGQEWFHAADVVFFHDGEERLRLKGVSRPEPFVHTVLQAQQAAAIRPTNAAAPAMA